MKKTKKLELGRQTIAQLDAQRLRGVRGGTGGFDETFDTCVDTVCGGGGGYISRPPKVCIGCPSEGCP